MTDESSSPISQVHESISKTLCCILTVYRAPSPFPYSKSINEEILQLHAKILGVREGGEEGEGVNYLS